MTWAWNHLPDLAKSLIVGTSIFAGSLMLAVLVYMIVFFVIAYPWLLLLPGLPLLLVLAVLCGGMIRHGGA